MKGMATIEDGSIDMVVTSPPYWTHRNYFIEGQLGQEETLEQYIQNLANVFDEVKRVLKPTGSFWLNMGDAFVNKNKLMIPHKLAIELQKRGWILRNDNIWFKPSHRPMSVQDRLTCSFEFMFHFVKKAKGYYYDLDSIRVPHKWASKDKRSKLGRVQHKSGKLLNAIDNQNVSCVAVGYHPLGKNPGDMWSINPARYPEAHFATFPEQLLEIPFKATVPYKTCKKCGKPPVKIYKKTGGRTPEQEAKLKELIKVKGIPRQSAGLQVPSNAKKEYVGLSDCGCEAGYVNGLVLDPFIGSGTTFAVAKKFGVSCIGIELQPEYAEMCEKRLVGDNLDQTRLKELDYALEVIS